MAYRINRFTSRMYPGFTSLTSRRIVLVTHGLVTNTADHPLNAETVAVSTQDVRQGKPACRMDKWNFCPTICTISTNLKIN